MTPERRGVTREEIGPGAQLIMDPQPGQEIAAIHLFLRMGSSYETEEQSGLSNLMQNLLLKGTETLNAEEFEVRLDSLGSRLAGSTGKEVGSLSLLATGSVLREALDLMVDVIVKPAMAEEEFEKERELALDEIQQRKDELLSHAFDLFQEAFYGVHPLHKPVQGREEVLRDLKPEDVRSFHDRVYVPRNMIFSCSGHFDPGMVRDLLSRAVQGSPPGKSGIVGPVMEAEEKVKGGKGGAKKNTRSRREVLEARESAAAWIVLGYPAPSYGEDGCHEMQVANAVLGGSMDSRLFTQLRERRGLAYQVSAVYRANTGPSFLAGYIGTDPRRYQEAVRELTAEFERLAQEEVGREELERAKEYLKGVFLIGGETMSARAARRGKFEILGLGYDYGDEYLRRIDRVTAEGLRGVAKRYLHDYALGAVVPKGYEKPARRPKNGRKKPRSASGGS